MVASSRRAAVRKWRESILISYEYSDHLISVSVMFVVCIIRLVLNRLASCMVMERT